MEKGTVCGKSMAIGWLVWFPSLHSFPTVVIHPQGHVKGANWGRSNGGATAVYFSVAIPPLPTSSPSTVKRGKLG